MKREALEILNARILPGQADCEMAATLLGVAVHDIAILIAAGLLKPLGNPSQWAQKYFLTSEILAFAEDRKWNDKARAAINRKWKIKNMRAKEQRESNEDHAQNGHEAA